MPTTTTAPDRSPERHEPVYWFAAMELAMIRGDLAGAAAAQRELERLGVKVQYCPPAKGARHGGR